MPVYLSIDTEATGLREPNHLLQVGVVPVDGASRRVFRELGREILLKCPSYEELLPTLDDWNRKHNKGLIERAHREGEPPETLVAWFEKYLAEPEVAKLFNGTRAILLGKSMSALDIPILRRYLGWERYEKWFHHHTLDVTCVARCLVDAGKMPSGTESSSKLIKFFGIRGDVNHTALSDALDMADAYAKMLDLLSPREAAKEN
jgi:DNA polymerase-3 subunit epsilon